MRDGTFNVSVDTHRKNILTKPNFNNSRELIAATIKQGWI